MLIQTIPQHHRKKHVKTTIIFHHSWFLAWYECCLCPLHYEQVTGSHITKHNDITGVELLIVVVLFVSLVFVVAFVLQILLQGYDSCIILT